MSSAKKIPAKRPAPRCRIYVADDFRLEQSGKVTAVGLYSDNVLVLNVSAGMPDPSRDKPFGVETLSVLVSISGLEGRHEVAFALTDDRGQSVAGFVDRKQVDFPNSQMAVQIIVRFRPLLVGSFGKKGFVVAIDDDERTFDFEIRRGLLVDADAAQSKLEAPAKSKRPVRKSRPKGVKATR